MRIRVHPHISDLAATGILMLGFLLVAMAVSAAPVLVRTLAGRPASTSSAPTVSVPNSPAVSLS